MRILPVIFFVLTPSYAGAGDYDGIYRPQGNWAQGWDCENIGMDGGAIAIRDGRLEGVESLCSLDNPTPVRGLQATLYDAECAAEGDLYSYRIMIMRTANGIATVQLGGVVSHFEYCQ